MEGGLLCLKWRDHRSTFFRILSSVRKKELYCDATIACDGRFYPVHKLVLSACSDYFHQMFELSENKNLMIVLTDISHKELETLLDYMYFGEVNILQSDLSVFMKAAEHLQIKGLAEPSEGSQKKQLPDNKRYMPQREDGCDTKRRRTDVDEISGRMDNSISQSSESSTSAKCVDGSGKAYFEPKIQKEETLSIRRGSVATSDILSPAQLASVELSTESSSTKRPEAAPTLSGAASQNSSSNNVSPFRGSQVKVEDYNVKEEPEDWSQTESHDSTQMIGFSDPGLAYLAHTSNLPVRTQDSGILSQMISSHSQSSSEDLQPHPLPGPSRIQSSSGSWEQQSLPVVLSTEEYTQFRGTNKGLSPRKMGRPTSEIWKHYKSYKIGEKTVAHCKYCLLKYGFPNATKMKAHIVKCKKCPEEVKKHFREVQQEVETVDNLMLREAIGTVQTEAKVLTNFATPE